MSCSGSLFKQQGKCQSEIISGMNATSRSRIQWISFPLSKPPTEIGKKIVGCFEAVHDKIETESGHVPHLKSNDVLTQVRPELEELGFEVERGKRKGAINVPVLYGERGQVKEEYPTDAWHKSEKCVLEVEAGRTVANNAFLKDLFEATLMTEIDHLVIACPIVYRTRDYEQRPYDIVTAFFNTANSSHRWTTPLKSILVIGY